MDKIKTKNIALLGSSFNPPHNGHLAVAKDLANNHKYDAIWLLPVFDHPFGKVLAPYADRLAMTKALAAAAGSPKIAVCEAEKDLAKRPSYTIDVIDYLQNQNPDTAFSFVVGSDAQQELDKWHRIDDLRRKVDFIFIPRQGFENSPYPEVSSTQMRNALANGEDVQAFMPKAVADYAINQKLYQTL